jgi:predicted DNA binding CopG/RHH family protein
MAREKQSRVPKFKSEEAERQFWATHDSSEYVDWSKAESTTMPKLRPSLKSISLRLPESLLERIKTLASKRDVPYQSLMKIFLTERVEEELHMHGSR